MAGFYFILVPLKYYLVYDFLVKLTKLPLKFFDVKMIGDTLQRINDHQRLESFITFRVEYYSDQHEYHHFGIVLATYNLQIFLIFSAGTILYFLWIQLFLTRRREIDFSRFKQMEKNHNAMIQFIMGMQEIRLNHCENKKITD